MKMEELYIDDYRIDNDGDEIIREVSPSGTSRTNGKTNYEHLKEYKAIYGEKEYVDFLVKEKVPNPRGIKIQDAALAQKVQDAGLQL